MRKAYKIQNTDLIKRPIKKATVTLDRVNFTYDGQQHVPKVSSVILDGKRLVQDTDYIVYSASMKNAGDYKVLVSGIENYAGTVAAEWHIKKNTGTLKANQTRVLLRGKENPQAKITLTYTGDGQISIDENEYVTGEIDGNILTLTGITEGDTTIIIRLSDGPNYSGTTTTLQATVDFVSIYGVEWNGTATTQWTRTDDAQNFVDPVPYYEGMPGEPSSPFDDLMPWAGMVRSTDDECGELVAIPKFWYKLEEKNSGLSIKIADKATEGFQVSPAHMDRGDEKGERDVVYVGRYFCNSNWKSETGTYPHYYITRSSCRTNISRRGETIYQIDYTAWFTILLLYLVEFANWDSQLVIGLGCSGNDARKKNNGTTDKIPYHTGTTVSNVSEDYGFTEYRNIEGLWDIMNYWLDGCYGGAEGFYIILNPSQFNETENGVCVFRPGTLSSSSSYSSISGYPSKFAVNGDKLYSIFYPIETQSSNQSIYLPDYQYYNTACPCFYAGGGLDHNLNYGIFYLSCTSATASVDNIGCRLMKLP